MRASRLLYSFLGLGLVGAYLVAPPGVAAPGAPADCSGWVQGSAGSTCANIEASYGLTEAQFEAWNPTTTELGLDCTLVASFYYCIQIDFASPSASSPSPTISQTSTTITTTSTGDGISTPTPYQTGMTTLCNSFHLVVAGDQCGTIASSYGISLSQFYAWNPAVGTTCQYLDLGDYVCVDIIGYTPTTTFLSTTTASSTTSSTTSTAAGNGIPTPTPYQTGMATNCVSFHLVVSGDQCGAIASDYGISLTDFYAWNPAVGTACQYLDLGDYVCVGVEDCTSASVLAAASAQDGLTCGAPGVSHDGATSLLIKSYTAGSPYVESAAACGAECLATSSCTNLYFIEGSYCNLHQGASTFGLSTASGYYLYYEASCFSPGSCGASGVSHDGSTSLLIASYTAGSPYVESAAACGAQCLATPLCTNLYFIEGSYCNLHQGASTFGASTGSGSYQWYEASCFSSGQACGSYGFSNDTTSTLITSYTSSSPYVASSAACGAQCLATSGCTNVYFIEGGYCNLHSQSSFLASTAAGYYSWFQSGCFACNSFS